MNNEFKAGDFTSGKMGAIFKSCHMDKLAVITHKQFGTAYLVPESEVRLIALNKLRALDASGNNLNHCCGTVASVKDYVLLLIGLHGNVESEIKGIKLDTWLDVVRAI
jgi:hypothetical protein